MLSGVICCFIWCHGHLKGSFHSLDAFFKGPDAHRAARLKAPMAFILFFWSQATLSGHRVHRVKEAWLVTWRSELSFSEILEVIQVVFWCVVVRGFRVVQLRTLTETPPFTGGDIFVKVRVVLPPKCFIFKRGRMLLQPNLQLNCPTQGSSSAHFLWLRTNSFP